METFFRILLQDPILLAAAMVLLAAVLILLWALKSLYILKHSSLNRLDDDTPEGTEPDENEGLIEARLSEISSQLAIISQRLVELEKTVKDSQKAKDQTVSTLFAPAEMEKLVKKIDAKLETIGAEKPVPAAGGESFGRLESKIEGIHKLLILLTDSGSEQK